MLLDLKVVLNKFDLDNVCVGFKFCMVNRDNGWYVIVCSKIDDMI